METQLKAKRDFICLDVLKAQAWLDSRLRHGLWDFLSLAFMSDCYLTLVSSSGQFICYPVHDPRQGEGGPFPESGGGSQWEPGGFSYAPPRFRTSYFRKSGIILY